MQSMQTLGLVNEDEDRVQMSGVLSLSNLGGKYMGLQSINVVDILALQRHLEIELMRKAMWLIWLIYICDRIVNFLLASATKPRP